MNDLGSFRMVQYEPATICLLSVERCASAFCHSTSAVRKCRTDPLFVAAFRVLGMDRRH
jgi:hypothetical protein